MVKNVILSEFNITPFPYETFGPVLGLRIQGKGDGVSIEAHIGRNHSDFPAVEAAIQILEDFLNSRLREQQEILGAIDDDPANVQ